MSEDSQRGAAWRLGPDVVAEQLGDEMVLVHLKTDRIYRLNRTGTSIWRYLTAGLTLDETKLQLLGEFDVDSDTVEREVGALVSMLLNAGLAVNDDGG